MTVVKKISHTPRKIIKAKQPIIVSMVRKQSIKSLEDCSLMIIGESGTGKTSLASMFDTFFVMLEPGVGELNIPFETVYNWEDFLEVAKGIGLKKGNFAKYIGTDTTGTLYDLCQRYMIKALDLKLVNDIKWGQWNDVRAEFEKPFQKLLNYGFKLISIFHMTKNDDKKDHHGNKYTEYTIRGGSQVVEYISSRSDIVLFIKYDVPNNPAQRIIYVRYDGTCPEKVRTRFDSKFRWKDTGKRIYSFKGGDSAQETFETIKKAFNNQLIEPKKKIWISSTKQPITKEK